MRVAPDEEVIKHVTITPIREEDKKLGLGGCAYVYIMGSPDDRPDGTQENHQFTLKVYDGELIVMPFSKEVTVKIDYNQVRDHPKAPKRYPHVKTVYK